MAPSGSDLRTIPLFRGFSDEALAELGGADADADWRIHADRILRTSGGSR